MTNSQDKIRNISSFKELIQQAKSFQDFKNAFPIWKDSLQDLGVDVSSVEAAFRETDIDDLTRRVDELTSLPDQFNDHFVERGWIMYEYMSVDIAKKAVQLAKDGDVGAAEQEIVAYYDSETIRHQIMWMKRVNAFRPRWSLSQKALDDYEAERYHACIPVVIALTDGLVQQVYVDVHGQGGNLSSEQSNLEAWDSIAAHSQGLEKLKDVILTSRYKTRTEQIRIPYRHGIMHGMDLGYDNKLVAAKAWAMFFAVGEWAHKAENGELDPPEDDDPISFYEILNKLKATQEMKQKADAWKPRGIKVGQDIPSKGKPDEFPEDTPERALVEFLHWWQQENYGYMARALLGYDGEPADPGTVRAQFDGYDLKDFHLVDLEDKTPVFTDINVAIQMEMFGNSINKETEVRMTKMNDDGGPALLDDGTWTLTTHIKLLSP